MPKYMNREQIDPIEATIDLCLEENKRVPVVYQGKLYYLYSVHTTSVELVDINEIYEKTGNQDEYIDFVPQKTITVYWSTHANLINYFVSLCNKQDELTHVDVKFAELQDHAMQIILIDQKFPENSTGRFYDFIEDHYELHVYEDVLDPHD